MKPLSVTKMGLHSRAVLGDKGVVRYGRVTSVQFAPVHEVEVTLEDGSIVRLRDVDGVGTTDFRKDDAP